MASRLTALLAQLGRAFLLVVLLLHALRIWLVGTVDTSVMGDFAVLWASSIAFATGLDPYDPSVLDSVARAHGIVVYFGPFNYPPLLLLLVAPLTGLAYATARMVWLGVLIVAFLITAVLLVSAVPPVPRRAYGRVLVGLGFLAYYPVPWNLIFGNFNPIVLMLVTLGLAIEAREWWFSGLPMGLALATKIIPAIGIIVAQLSIGAWRRATAALVWAGIASLVAAIVLGPSLTLHYVLDRAPRFLAGDYANEINYPFNQALGGGLGRLFREGGDVTPWIVSPTLAQVLHAASALALLIGTVIATRRASTESRLRVLPLIAIVLTMVLPTYSHAYYAVWLLPCFACAVGQLLMQSRSASTWWLSIALACSYVLTGFVYDYDASALRAGALLPFTSLPLLGMLLLWLVLVVQLARAGPQDYK